PSRVVIGALVRAGATVVAHDPVAVAEMKKALLLDLADAPGLMERISFVEKPMAAVEQADGLIVVTEWKAYRSLNFRALRAAMKFPVVFDGRNLYEPAMMSEQGITYFGIGRSQAVVPVQDANTEVPHAQLQRH
ncbi:MAG: hypothetical protein EON92_20670, partial [Burkholderiales bacterium]